MADEPNFRYTPIDGIIENIQFEFSRLYLHYIFSAASPAQSNVKSADATTAWGKIVVNSWPIYDGVGPDAKLVAHAQGLHIYAGSWHNTFTIVFETERFKESTLQVMGASVEEDGQWSILGGTGELAMARGVITKKRLHMDDEIDGGDIIELTIRGFCHNQMPVTITKSGPWGSTDGDVVDSEKPKKIKSITVRGSYPSVVSIEYSYINQNGDRRTAGPWGRGTNTLAEIVLAPDEILTEVSGTFYGFIYTIKFVTNKKTYGPYGYEFEQKETFSAVAPDGKQIIGFFGRACDYLLRAIGVYIA